MKILLILHILFYVDSRQDSSEDVHLHFDFGDMVDDGEAPGMYTFEWTCEFAGLKLFHII